jgi:hypothetical protein
MRNFFGVGIEQQNLSTHDRRSRWIEDCPRENAFAWNWFADSWNSAIMSSSQLGVSLDARCSQTTAQENCDA